VASEGTDSLAVVDQGTPIETFEVKCPHCKKQFEAQLIDGATAPHRGFKCPHCKLFVPYERSRPTGPGLAESLSTFRD
jgi:transposase-like protein